MGKRESSGCAEIRNSTIKLQVDFSKVKGHSGDVGNDRADTNANNGGKFQEFVSHPMGFGRWDLEGDKCITKGLRKLYIDGRFNLGPLMNGAVYARYCNCGNGVLAKQLNGRWVCGGTNG